MKAAGHDSVVLKRFLVLILFFIQANYDEETYWHCRMADNTPQPVDEGKWRRDGNQLCFESVNAETAYCFVEQAFGEDGSFTLTGEEGQVSEFLPEAVPGLM